MAGRTARPGNDGTVDDNVTTADGDACERALRVAVLAKQVPVAEALELGPGGRLRRAGTELEMNPYCRRAVAKGVELARTTGGTCTVYSLGPPSAEDVLREAVAWGADEGVLLTDPAFAGSDTLATARALAAAIGRDGPFDLVVVGRNTTDGDTGQVGPELAELLGLPFAAGVRRLHVALAGLELGLELGLEQDDGWEEVVVTLPAVVSVAERLCEPCKVDPEGRAAVPADRVRHVRAAQLGDGPWGDAGSPTRVGAVRVLRHGREGRVLSGPLADQVAEAVRLLDARGALATGPAGRAGPVRRSTAAAPPEAAASADASASPPPADVGGPIVVVLEPGRPQVGGELLGAAVRLASEVGATVVAVVPPVVPAIGSAAASGAHDGANGAARTAAPGGATDGAPPAPRPGRSHGDEAAVGWREVAPGLRATDDSEALAAGLGALGVDRVLRGWPAEVADVAAEDLAGALGGWLQGAAPWALLAPGTAFGREVASRAAASLGAGLVGDAVGVEVVGGRLVAAKPAFSGALVADITCTSSLQLVTVRPGVLDPHAPIGTAERPPSPAVVERLAVAARGRVRTMSARRDDDVEVLARAAVVVGVGSGVAPEEYGQLSPLAAVLGAELAATRKVTDRGWAPRSRQVGITGRSISPRLYVAVGVAGKFNHMVGVRSAGTVLAVNRDADAPVFAHADLGIVGDWHQVVPLLTAALRSRRADRHVAVPAEAT